MIVGVHKVICTCEREMRRTGGTFGGGSPTTDTYYCDDCEKHVIVVTPNKEEQSDFTQRLKQRG